MLRRLAKSWRKKGRKERPDVFVISYPKSGRTWHHLLIGNYLARLTGSDLRLSLKLRHLCRKTGGPLIAYHHNGANFTNGLAPDDPRVACPRKWAGKRVIFLIRDPRDVLTSAYFHARYRRRTFHGDIGQFIRKPETGAEKLFTALSRWAERRHLAAAAMTLTYEELHRDAGGSLAKSLRFAGYGEPDPKLVEEAVAFARPENMRRLEQENFFKTAKMRAGISGGEHGSKVRAATVGNHALHLSPDDLMYIDDLYVRFGGAIKQLIDWAT
jgi:hypothetical protein